jgi:hypothetical protein
VPKICSERPVGCMPALPSSNVKKVLIVLASALIVGGAVAVALKTSLFLSAAALALGIGIMTGMLIHHLCTRSRQSLGHSNGEERDIPVGTGLIHGGPRQRNVPVQPSRPVSRMDSEGFMPQPAASNAASNLQEDPLFPGFFDCEEASDPEDRVQEVSASAEDLIDASIPARERVESPKPEVSHSLPTSSRRKNRKRSQKKQQQNPRALLAKHSHEPASSSHSMGAVQQNEELGSDTHHDEIEGLGRNSESVEQRVRVEPERLRQLGALVALNLAIALGVEAFAPQRQGQRRRPSRPSHFEGRPRSLRNVHQFSEKRVHKGHHPIQQPQGRGKH